MSFRGDEAWQAASTSLPARRHGTLYTGCTTDLPKRIHEHRGGLVPGFTRKYGIKRLVYFEEYDDVSDAIVRERRIKEWRRDWKVQLIEKDNPEWADLAVSILGFEPIDRVPDQSSSPAGCSSGHGRVHGSRLSPG